MIDRLLDGLRCPAVTTDDVQVGILATEHLIKFGHKKIGHLRGTSASTSQGRLEGYKQAMAKARLRVDRSMVHECGFTESDGRDAMSDWIATGNLPSAIFAANDPAAIGAALNDAGSTCRTTWPSSAPEISTTATCFGAADHGVVVDCGDGSGGRRTAFGTDRWPKAGAKSRRVTIPPAGRRRSCGALKQ